MDLHYGGRPYIFSNEPENVLTCYVFSKKLSIALILGLANGAVSYGLYVAHSGLLQPYIPSFMAYIARHIMGTGYGFVFGYMTLIDIDLKVHQRCQSYADRYSKIPAFIKMILWIYLSGTMAPMMGYAMSQNVLATILPDASGPLSLLFLWSTLGASIVTSFCAIIFFMVNYFWPALPTPANQVNTPHLSNQCAEICLFSGLVMIFMGLPAYLVATAYYVLRHEPYDTVIGTTATVWLFSQSMLSAMGTCMTEVATCSNETVDSTVHHHSESRSASLSRMSSPPIVFGLERSITRPTRFSHNMQESTEQDMSERGSRNTATIVAV